MIEPLLPVSGRGNGWRDHRQVIKAILSKLRTGAPWRDLPDWYGPRVVAPNVPAGWATRPARGSPAGVSPHNCVLFPVHSCRIREIRRR
ncbi:transposase [Saccharothrix sp. MB29]|nr:transposase [Saccharothrix sp. MB29]